MGSLGLALTIFKSSFKYLSFIVISSLQEYVASFEALLVFSTFASTKVDCALPSKVIVVPLELLLQLVLLLAKELKTVSPSGDGSMLLLFVLVLFLYKTKEEEEGLRVLAKENIAQQFNG